jgi:hypothetical protein
MAYGRGGGVTYSGSGMSRNSPALRNFSGLSCAAGLTCSLTRRVLPRPSE